MKYSLKRLLLMVTICAVILGVARMMYVELTRVEFGENAPSVSWLPKTATNVSFYRSYSFTAYEYEISEDDFLKSSPWKLGSIDGTITVARFSHRTRVPDIGPNATEEEMQVQAKAWEAKRIQVSDGWYYSNRHRNGGGVVLAYDRKLKKAFFWSAPR